MPHQEGPRRQTDASTLACVAETPKQRQAAGRRRRRLGFVLGGLSIATVVIFAFQDSATAAPPAEAGLFVLIAAVLQVAAIVLISGGRADPAHAMSSFRHLMLLARRASIATALAEEAAEADAPVPAVRRSMNRLSVELSWIQEGLIEAGEHWAQAHPELVSDDEPELDERTRQ